MPIPASQCFRQCPVAVVLALLWAACGARAQEIQAGMAPDGSSFRIDAPGVLALKAGFGATIERDGRRIELSSVKTDKPAAMVAGESESPSGTAAIQTATLGFADHGCELLFQFGRLPGLPGVTVSSGVRNTGSTPLRLVSTSPVSMAGAQAGNTGNRVFLETKMASAIEQKYGVTLDNFTANQTPLCLFGENFARGIGCLAPSDMRFPLNGRFTRFQCVAGVDDSGSGTVTFEVHADGKKLFDSGQVLSGQPGRVIDLDVTGAKELRLVATDAGDGSNFDWANWADARLTPVTGIDSLMPPADAAVIRLTSPLANWLASPMTSQPGGLALHPLDRAFDPLTIREAGGLYDRDGRGLFFGPVGTPVAYLSSRIGNAGNQRATLDLDCAMDSVVVLPGQTRWGQQVMMAFERPEAARERWISWVADSHRARPPRAPLNGWLSWYWLGMNVSESNLIEVVDFAAKSGGIPRPDVIQIDDGYQRADRQPGMNEKFPSGMQGVASKLAAGGAMPGLMVRLETNDEAGIHQFLGTVRHAVADGFRYFKIAEIDAPVGNEENQTFFERKRAFYQSIRQAAGDDTYLLAVGNGTDRACVGAVDACRVTGSTERHKIALGMDDVLRSLAFNRRWFTVDSDCYYLATDIEKLPPMAGGWTILRTWLSVTGLTGGNAMTSDPWHWDSMAPFLRHTEILSPPARESARAIDIGVSPDLPRVVGQVTRPWGSWTVALLWNPQAAPRAVTLDFAKAGMDTRRKHAVWSFWDNQFLGIADGSWTTPVLAQGASQHLRFTPVDEPSLKPALIGSNLHVWCGAAEFQHVTALQGAMEIELTDAGARAGEIFIRCTSRPELRVATGCTVKAIEKAGDNLWRLSLQDRQRGAPQRIELGVHLPVTSHPWFWVLVTSLAASLLFGIWRYGQKRRMQREMAVLKMKSELDEERARIARDLHDELGANLARIGLLVEKADAAIGEPENARLQLDRILATARGINRQLDSVVWAVDPANDTLESLAMYLHGHAEDYLGMADIRCRFEAGKLPDIPLSSAFRHHLLMIVKEALHNVVKHAGATKVILRILPQDDQLVVEIEDNGKGIGPPDSHRRGNGLGNIRKRVAALSGTCDFLSPPGGMGTLVRLTIPAPTRANL